MGNQPYLFSAAELGACFEITDRRVRQYAEAGDLPRQARNQYDGAWLCYLLRGRRITDRRKNKPSARVCVAIGWKSAAVSDGGDERDAFIRLFERNGLTRDDALLALGEASVVPV